MAQAYKHSGNMGNGLWSIPIAAIPATLMLSVLYAYACVYNPVDKLAVLLPVGYGALLAYIVARAGKAAKCRSVACVTLMGLLCSVIGIYVSWAVFLHVLLDRFSAGRAVPSILDLALWPSVMWSLMESINVNGWFTLGSSTPSGLFLWICWAGEALIIIGFATILPARLMRPWVFCEPCGTWCAEKNDLARFGWPAPGEQNARVLSGDFTVLSELPPYAGGKTPHVRLNNRRCEACGQTETIEIQRIWYQQNNKGLVEKSDLLRAHTLLDADALNALQTALLARVTPVGQPALAPKP